ncbi:MAG: hypothetical protein JWL64_1875 [Frankiales bacterium]|nr:hypothetical protein [Frankiales bacterium]
MLRATFRSLLARKLRLLLSGLAIVLGVAFVAAALTLTDSLGKTFDNLFSDLGQNTDAVVRAQSDLDQFGTALRPRLDAGALQQLQGVPGVRAAEGEVNGYAQIVKRNGKAYSPGGAPALGTNYPDKPELSTLSLREGTAPAAADEVAIDATTARKTGFHAGDRVQVVVSRGVQDVTISGVFGVGDSDSFAGASILAFATPTAQELIGEPGTFDALSFAAEPGVTQQQLVDDLQKVLPSGLEAVTGDAASKENRDALDPFVTFFNIFLLIFAGVALFVGGFLIFNTFTILVAQRTRELALLRALGASRRQVTTSVLVEATVVGVVASAVGLGVGIALALLLKALVGDSVPVDSLLIAPRTVIVSMLVGVLITVVSAVLPATRASRVAPIAAMRDAETPDLSLRRRTLVGGAALLVGAVALVLGLAASPWWLVLGSIGLFSGTVAVAPRLAQPVLGLVGAPLRRGLAGRLGQRNAIRNPRRTSATAVALMIGLTLVTGVSVLGSSARKSIESVVGNSLTAPVIVVQTGNGQQGIPQAVAPAVQQLPQVGTVDVLRSETAKINGSDQFVSAVSAGSVGRSFTLDRVAGDLSGLRQGTLLMSEEAAKSRDATPGRPIRVQFAQGGEQEFTLAGTYRRNELAGDYLFDLSASTDFNTQLVTALLLSPAVGVSAAQLQDAVNSATQQFPTVEALTGSEFSASVAGQVDVFINVVTVLLVLSVIIAMLGIVNTLALAVFERTREIGLLRAVGLGRRQTRAMIRAEAVLVSVFGALLGIVLGTVLGAAAQHALADQGIPEFAYPYGRVVLCVVLAALAGVLAALLPARRAARLDILQAIAST